MNICKNCDNPFTGEFCNECGQKVSHKITMGHIAHEFLHSFTHADKGFFHLLVQLFIRPGTVGREYIIEGKRKRYFMPFQYILIIGALAAFVAVNSHYFSNSMSTIDKLNGPTSANQLKFITSFGGFLSKYYNFLILFQLPFFAFGSYIVFKKHKLLYAEHLTFQTFITAQITIISMFIMLVIYVLKTTSVFLVPIISTITLSYQVYAVTQFFKERKFKGIIKAIVSTLIGIILFTIAMTVFVIVFIKVTN